MITYSTDMREKISKEKDDLPQGKDRIFFILNDSAYKIETTHGINETEYNIYERNKNRYGKMLMKVLDHSEDFKIIQVEKLIEISEYIENKTGIYDEEIEYMSIQEVIDKYKIIKDCKKFNFNTFNSFIKRNNLNKKELQCSFNWGITQDDRLVCLDFADEFGRDFEEEDIY